MALKKFRAAPLPNPPADYDPQHIRQMIRVIETYFSQLDSNTPNYAESYTAGTFDGVFVPRGYTTTEKLALPAQQGWIVFDTTLGKLCVFNGTGWETITSV